MVGLRCLSPGGGELHTGGEVFPAKSGSILKKEKRKKKKEKKHHQLDVVFEGFYGEDTCERGFALTKCILSWESSGGSFSKPAQTQ